MRKKLSFVFVIAVAIGSNAVMGCESVLGLDEYEFGPDDSGCSYNYDGTCDEPEGTGYCAEGTDAYDCGGGSTCGATTCQSGQQCVEGECRCPSDYPYECPGYEASCFSGPVECSTMAYCSYDSVYHACSPGESGDPCSSEGCQSTGNTCSYFQVSYQCGGSGQDFLCGGDYSYYVTCPDLPDYYGPINSSCAYCNDGSFACFACNSGYEPACCSGQACSGNCNETCGTGYWGCKPVGSGSSAPGCYDSVYAVEGTCYCNDGSSQYVSCGTSYTCEQLCSQYAP
jgi:hypothetical protein